MAPHHADPLPALGRCARGAGPMERFAEAGFFWKPRGGGGVQSVREW